MMKKNMHTPGVRRAPEVIATHLFAIGQVVRMKSGLPVPAAPTADTYQIVAKLPPSGNSPQYRIRNEAERYERVTTEDKLEAVGTKSAGRGANLMERTFGHG